MFYAKHSLGIRSIRKNYALGTLLIVKYVGYTLANAGNTLHTKLLVGSTAKYTTIHTFRVTAP